MTIYVADIIPIIVAFQSLLFFIVLFTDNGPKRTSNRYLASFLLLLCFQFSIVLSENHLPNAHYIRLSLCSYGFAYGPLLFFYCKSLIYKTFEISYKQLFHFIPFLSVLVMSLLGFQLCSTIGPFLYLSLIIYIVFSIKAMIHYRKVLQKTQSLMNKANLIWLQWTIIIFCVALILDFIDQTLWDMHIFNDISTIHVTILLFVNWMFYNGLKQPRLFLGITKLEEELLEVTKNAQKVKTPNAQEQQELENLLGFMNKTEIYTNDKLNLTELAKLVGISPRKLSYLINSFLNQNFMSFINEFRIKKAMERLVKPKEEGETIMEVMYEVGFNSKSSFNTLFKKQTGLSPSEYKKKNT